MASNLIPLNQRKLEYFLLILLTIGSLNFVMVSTDLTGYPYDIDYSEGFILEDTSRLISTGSLYPEPSLENGFESVKYPPLYYMVLGLIGSIANLSFLTGRILNITLLAAIFGLIYLFIRERDHSANYVPLILLTSYLTLFTTLTLRTDVLALFLSFLGLYLFERNRIHTSAVALVLAFLTKQIFIAGFGAVNLYILYNTDLRKLFNQLKEFEIEKILKENPQLWKFNLTYGLGLLVTLSMILAWNPHFLQNTLFANLGGFEIRWDLLSWAHFAFLPIFGLASYYVYMCRDWLLGSYFFLSLATMTLQMTRGGAWIHPALQPFLAAVICVSLLYSKLEVVRRPITILLILQTLIFFTAPMVSGNIFDIHKMDDKNQNTDKSILWQVENSNRNVYVEHIGYELKAEDNPSPEVWGIYEQQSSGKISKEKVASFFRQKNYSKIITYKRIRNLAIQDYLRENYRMTKQYERYDMLLNRENWRIYKWNG